MLHRVVPELMGLKNVLVLNDEAHHCYREKADRGEEKLTGDDKKEAQKNNEAARLWIAGIETVKRHLGVPRVYDLSATPFFLRGSGYPEGVLFHWTACDFSLMDAIECGVVKLPRVPVADNIPGSDMPMFRDLWKNIRADMPKKGRGKGGDLDPQKLPTRFKTALEALYGHYEKTFHLWQDAGIKVPPCFIIVCQNTAVSKLVFDYISGFLRANEDGSQTPVGGALKLFQNHDEHGNPLARPNTLLIDSEQLEAGDALDANFRAMAADEIDRFRRDVTERTGDQREAEFRIADTFTGSLARLTGDEQKAVKTAAFDLQLNPANPGMSFHKLDKARDKNFWSVRVNKDIRVIVHKAAGSLLLCYVDHHDKAYEWAERRKLEVHPKTGAAQLVEIRETVQEIAVPKYVEVARPKAAERTPFDGIADDVLLSYGVPTEWLADVKAATEDNYLALADHLPAEAAEALLELATGGKPRAAKPVGTAAGPFDHPDALRRFRAMADVEELRRALDYPWEKWLVFLHPDQRETVERKYAGPARVSGSRESRRLGRESATQGTR